MTDLTLLFGTGPTAAQQAELLTRCNAVSAPYGLALSADDLRQLQQRRAQALYDSDRFEPGEGVLRQVVDVFCDSPYLTPQNYLETLCDLQEAFYYFKTESRECFTDDDLLDWMRRRFDNPCRGSSDMLCGTPPEEVGCDDRQGDEPFGETDDRYEESEGGYYG